MTEQALVPAVESLATPEACQEAIDRAPAFETSFRNEAYRKKLSLLAGQQPAAAPGQQQVSADVQQAAQQLVSAREAAEGAIDGLRARGYDDEIAMMRDDGWTGDSAVERLAIGRAVAADFPRAVAIAEQHGVSEVALLRMAAELGRALGYTWSTPGTAAARQTAVKTTTPPSTSSTTAPATNRAEIEQRIKALDARIMEARAEGSPQLRDSLYQEQLKLRARLGNAPIVGSAGRWA